LEEKMVRVQQMGSIYALDEKSRLGLEMLRKKKQPNYSLFYEQLPSRRQISVKLRKW
jgi:hypothetical protein